MKIEITTDFDKHELDPAQFVMKITYCGDSSAETGYNSLTAVIKRLRSAGFKLMRKEDEDWKKRKIKNDHKS